MKKNIFKKISVFILVQAIIILSFGNNSYANFLTDIGAGIVGWFTGKTNNNNTSTTNVDVTGISQPNSNATQPSSNATQPNNNATQQSGGVAVNINAGINFNNLFTIYRKELSANKTSQLNDLTNRWNDYNINLDRIHQEGFVTDIYYNAMKDGLKNSGDAMKSITIDGDMGNSFLTEQIIPNLVWVRSPKSFANIYNKVAEEYTRYYRNYTPNNQTQHTITGYTNYKDPQNFPVNGTTEKFLRELEEIAMTVYGNGIFILNNGLASPVTELTNIYGSEHSIKEAITEVVESDEAGNESVNWTKLITPVLGNEYCYSEEWDDVVNTAEGPVTIHRAQAWKIKYPQLFQIQEDIQVLTQLHTYETAKNVTFFDGNSLIDNPTDDKQNGVTAFYNDLSNVQDANNNMVNLSRMILDMNSTTGQTIEDLSKALENYSKNNSEENGTKVLGFYKKANVIDQGLNSRLETGDVFITTKTPEKFTDDNWITQLISGRMNPINDTGYDIQYMIGGISMYAIRMREINAAVMSQIGSAIQRDADDGYISVKGREGGVPSGNVITAMCPKQIKLEYISKINADTSFETKESDVYYDLMEKSLIKKTSNIYTTNEEKKMGEIYDLKKSFMIAQSGNLLVLDYLGYFFEKDIANNWIPIGRMFRIPESSIEVLPTTGNKYKFKDKKSIGYWAKGDADNTFPEDADYSISIYDLCDKTSMMNGNGKITLDGDVEEIQGGDSIKGRVSGYWEEENGKLKFRIDSSGSSSGNSNGTIPTNASIPQFNPSSAYDGTGWEQNGSYWQYNY